MGKKHLQILQESQTRTSNLALFLSNYATQANVGTLSVEEILRHQQQVNDGGDDASLVQEVEILTHMRWVDLKEEEEKRRRKRREEKGKEAEHNGEVDELDEVVPIHDVLAEKLSNSEEWFPGRLVRLSETLAEHVRRMLAVSLFRDVSCLDKDVAVGELAETLVWDLRSLAVTAVFASATLESNIAGQTVQERLLVQGMYLALTVLRFLQAVEAFVVDEQIERKENGGHMSKEGNVHEDGKSSSKLAQTSKLLRRLSLSRKRAGGKNGVAMGDVYSSDILDENGEGQTVGAHSREPALHTDRSRDWEETTLRSISKEVADSIHNFLDCIQTSADVYTTIALTKSDETIHPISSDLDSGPKSHSMMELCPRRPSSASRGFLHRQNGSIRKSSFSLPRPGRPRHPSFSNSRPRHRTASYSGSAVSSSFTLPDAAWNDDVDPPATSNLTPRSVSGPPGSIAHSAKQMLKKILPSMPWKKAILSFAPKSSERATQPLSDTLTEMSENCHFTDIRAEKGTLDEYLGEEAGSNAEGRTLQEMVIAKGLSKVSEDKIAGGKKGGIFHNLQRRILKTSRNALGQDVSNIIGAHKTDEVKTSSLDSKGTIAGYGAPPASETQAIADILSIAHRLSQSHKFAHPKNQTSHEQKIELLLERAFSQVGDLVLRKAGEDGSASLQIEKKLESVIDAALEKADIPHVHPLADKLHRMREAITRGNSVSGHDGFENGEANEEDSEEEERLAVPLRRRSSVAPNRRWVSADDVERSSEHAYRSALKSPRREWASDGDLRTGTLDGTMSNCESSRRPIKRQVSFKGLPDDEFVENEWIDGKNKVDEKAEKKNPFESAWPSDNPTTPSAPFGNSRGSLFVDDSDAWSQDNLSGSDGSVYQHEDGGSNDNLDLHGVPISDKGEQEGTSKRRISLPPAYAALKRRISALRRISRSDQGTAAPGVSDSDRNAYLEKLGMASSMASQAGVSKNSEGGTVEMGANQMPMPIPHPFMRMPEPTISQSVPQQMPQPQHQPYESYYGQLPFPMAFSADDFCNMTQNAFGFPNGYLLGGVNLPPPQIATFQTTVPIPADGSYGANETFPQIRFMPIPVTVPVPDTFQGDPSAASIQLNLAQYYADAVNSELAVEGNMQQQGTIPQSNGLSMADVWAGNTTAQIEQVYPSHVPVLEVFPPQQWMFNYVSPSHTEAPALSTRLPERSLTEQPTAYDKLTKVMFKRGWDVPSCAISTQITRESFMAHMVHKILGGGVKTSDANGTEEERYTEGRIELDDKGYLHVYHVFQRRIVPSTKLSSSLYLKHGVIDSKRRVQRSKSVWHHTSSEVPTIASSGGSMRIQLRLMNGTHMILKFESLEEADAWRGALRKTIDRVTSSSSRRGDRRRRKGKRRSALPGVNSYKQATAGQ